MSEVAQESHEDFHGDYGTLSATDYFLLACKLVWILDSSSAAYRSLLITRNPHCQALSISSSSERRPSSNSYSLHRQIPRLVFDLLHHRTNRLLTHRQIRVLIRPSASTILASRPYGSASQNLFHRISRPRFTGYWVIQSSFTAPQSPRHSDVTIFFLHGGGYFASRPDTYLLFLLRLAEAILAQDVKVSIFALDYHLAPEYLYPTQLEEAVAAYEYLLREMAIPAEKVVVAGDSAGGHLVLSMLVSLHQCSSLPKSGGAMLFSPWLSLHHIPRTNTETDVLSASFLRATARRFLGPNRADRKETMGDPLLEFLNPHPEIDWDAVLPSWLWVSAGTNEIMFDDLVIWTQALEQRLGRERVGCEWGEGEVHDWQWLETMDEGPKKKFLMKEGNCEDFEAVARVRRLVGERVVRGNLGGCAL